MNSLNAFNYDDNDNKKSNKSLFDLMNEEVDDVSNDVNSDDSLRALDIFGDVQDNKQEITPEPSKKVVGSFDEDLFKPTESDVDSIPRTVMTGQVDYSAIKDRLEKEKQAKALKEEEERKAKIESELALPKEIQEQKPQRRVKRVSSKIDGISSNHINIVGNDRRSSMIKSNPNEIIIPNLKNLYVRDDYKIEGVINNNSFILDLLGFTSKFEAVFKLNTFLPVTTGGSSRVISDGISQYLLNEVFIFELGDDIELKINDVMFRINFKETNKRNKSIKTLPYFEISNVKIQIIN